MERSARGRSCGGREGTGGVDGEGNGGVTARCYHAIDGVDGGGDDGMTGGVTRARVSASE